MLRRQFRVAEPVPSDLPSASAGSDGDVRSLSGQYPGTMPDPLAAIVDLPETRPIPETVATIRDAIHRRLIEELNQKRLSGMSPEDARRSVREAASQVINTLPAPGVGEWRLQVLDELADEVLGFGPLEPLLRDDTISEIMVNGPEDVWVERRGRLVHSVARFRDRDHIMHVIERIVAPIGRHVDEGSPMVDARLPDGSRVNIVVPPAAPDGPKITLRKFARQRLTHQDLERIGTLTPEATGFLRACVQAELNILVSGGTGTGKTTLLNVLSSFIGEHERVVTIEDPVELQLQQAHVVSLEARPPSLEGTRQITQRDLVRNALRMRPDRVIVGEVRGGEAFDMLQAMNTGHDGSLSTVHANTPRDAVSRIENMVLMAGYELPDHAVREQIASAIQMIVQISRLPDGSRRITHVTEIAGIEGQTLLLQDIFVLEVDGQDESGQLRTRFRPTGLQPHFKDRFARAGVAFPGELLRRDDWGEA